MRQVKSVRYFVVREFTAGCLLDSDPITLHSPPELRQHLRDIRECHLDDPYTVHTPVNRLVSLQPGETAIYIQTERLWKVEVEAVMVFVRDSYLEQPANAFSNDYSYQVDSHSQDLNALIEHHRAHIMGYCEPGDITAAYVLVENSDYLEVWVTTSTKPYQESTRYTLVFGTPTQLPVTKPQVPIPPETKRSNDYHGWSNYPTWCVALWLDNDPHTERETRSMMRQHRTVYAYADALSDYVESLQELYDLPTSGMFTDLLGYAVSCVDWDEIAENFADGYFDD